MVLEYSDKCTNYMSLLSHSPENYCNFIGIVTGPKRILRYNVKEQKVIHATVLEIPLK
jgi:hypothetical protein